MTINQGDIVQVTDRASKFDGCVLTYIGKEQEWHICQNSYGFDSRVVNGQHVNVIKVKRVKFLR